MKPTQKHNSMGTIETNLSPANAAIGTAAQDLDDIHLPDKSIAIYQRDVALLTASLTPLAEQVIKCKADGTVEEITAALTTYFNQTLPEHQAFLEDILKMLGLFQMVTEAPTFRVLLGTVHTDMCRKFHADINKLRMLCTYVGPGTLWLPEEAVNYQAYEDRSDNDEIVIDDGLIQQVATGDVTILKGARYPQGEAILHRSPTIEATDEKRLLLRIDMN